MGINLDDFVILDKHTIRREKMIVLSGGIIISPDVTKRFIDEDKGSIYVKFGYSKQQDALQIIKSSEEGGGYKFPIRRSDGSATQNATPNALKKSHVARGEYIEHPDHPNIFVLNKITQPEEQESPTDKYLLEESTNIEVGDIVSWICESKSHTGRYIATGRIVGILKKKEEKKPRCEIYPISKNWLDDHPDALRQAKVITENLIIREKANV